jgi:hypothetical protein
MLWELSVEPPLGVCKIKPPLIGLSETTLGKKWLAQFLEADRATARLLLDSFVLVGDADLREGLRMLVEKEAATAQFPIALVPIRKVSEDYSYFKIGNKDSVPKVVLSGSLPGSEGLIANLAKAARKADTTGRLMTGIASLPNLRAAKCRTVFFLDDCIGSGKRVRDFINAFSRHPTIKSWRSYPKLEYRVLVYAATDVGMRKVAARKVSIRYIRTFPVFSEMNWSDHEEAAIRALCKKYAPREDEFALGFGETKGMLVFAHSVPNNLPAIVWRGGTNPVSGKRWTPLFPGRSVPTGLLTAFRESSLQTRVETRLARLGQPQLSRGRWLKHADDYVRKVILVLSSVARTTRTVERISEVTGLSTIEANLILDSCRKWGLISANHRLTGSGANELLHARKLSEKTDREILPASSEFYYPQSLRKAR